MGRGMGTEEKGGKQWNKEIEYELKHKTPQRDEIKILLPGEDQLGKTGPLHC